MTTIRESKSQNNGAMSWTTPDEKIEAHFGRVASLIGERSRAIMLWNLLDGRAYTATELALCANISKQACSSHLNLLLEAEILTVEKQGRHRYFMFASDSAAHVIEGIASLMRRDLGTRSTRDEIPEGIRYARTCYDHLAGRAGVAIYQGVISQGLIMKQGEILTLTPQGEQWCNDLSINTEELRKQNRKFVYACLDWSERKHHLGGSLAAAMLTMFVSLEWVRPARDSREVVITPQGKAELGRILNVDF